ncbi:MAG TPA: DUF1801 domain-containing protein [Candidatus Dormibacteraeota bacterium]|nr:DUF1801 domain-containing protein [Candidatus Dormibacteraeota bacterium]
MKVKPKAAKSTKKTFTAEERAAIQERAREAKAEERRGAGADAEAEQLAKIAQMNDSDRAIAMRIHAVVKATAPDLTSKLWYGMPGYARNGKLICFFQPAQKFKTRYATLGFNDPAQLDDGSIWPVAFAVKTVTAVEEAKIAALIKKAAGTSSRG